MRNFVRNYAVFDDLSLRQPTADTSLIRGRRGESLFFDTLKKGSGNPLPFLFMEMKKSRTLSHSGFFGAAGRTRTADLVITNDVLYHLSYSSIFYAADFHLRHSGDREGARTLDLQRDRLAY